MTIYRFRVEDLMNPWATAVEIEADDPDQAVRRAEHWLFARRDVGAGVTLTLPHAIDTHEVAP